MIVCVALGYSGWVSAQEEGLLTRSQWTKMVGASAQDSDTLKATLRQVPAGERTEFAQKTLKAVTRMPLGTEEKSKRYVESAILFVGNVTGNDKYDVIAESIATALVPHLPALITEMAPRFDPKANQLTPEQYQAIADKGVQTCFKRNAEVEDTTIRNTFAILLFTKADPGNKELEDALLAKLPENRSRELAAGWLADAAKGDYTAILAAAEVLAKPPLPAINLVGYPETERLLATFLASDTLSLDTITGGGTGSSAEAIDIQVDAGINQTPLIMPRGYANQGTSLLPPGNPIQVPPGNPQVVPGPAPVAPGSPYRGPRRR